jgi:DNA-binding MarR family transcriptional regulator
LSRPTLQRHELLALLQQAGREQSAAVVMFHTGIGELLGLSASDHKALDMVAERAPVTAGELAAYTGLSSGTVTGVIDRLERAGMLERRRDPSDRRKVLLHPSDRFGSAVGRLFEGFAGAWAGLLEEYDDAQLALLLDFVRRSTELLRRETRTVKGERRAEPEIERP